MILPKHDGGYVDPGGVVMPLRQALALAGCCPSVREAKALLAQRTAEITLWPAAGTSNIPYFALEDGKHVFFGGDELQTARQMPRRLDMK